MDLQPDTTLRKGYATMEDEEALNFCYDHRQVFHHEFSPGRTMAEYGIIRAFSGQSQVHRQIGIAVVDFLRSFGFATFRQLTQMLEQRGIEAGDLEQVLQQYLDLRVLNFCIAADMDMPIPEDALRIYCLDYGATHILSHFASANMVGWLSTDSIRPIRLVVMYLATVRFYLAMSEAGIALHYFRPIPDINIGKRMVRFSADFQLDNGSGTGRSFVLEVLRNVEFPIDWLKKMDQIEQFLNPRVCERYYGQPPMFILLAENNAIALEAAEIFARRIPSGEFRVTTDKEMEKGMDHAKFYKFMAATEAKPARLAAIRTNLFRPPRPKG